MRMALIQGMKNANKTRSRFERFANGGFLEGKANLGEGGSTDSAPYRPHVEKHPLWPTLRCTLDGQKTISFIPADPIPISVCDDATTANFIGDSHADAEC